MLNVYVFCMCNNRQSRKQENVDACSVLPGRGAVPELPTDY